MGGPLAFAALAVLLLVSVTGAWLDLRYRLLPNWLCAAALLAGLGFAFAQGGAGLAASAAGHAMVALVVGMGLFALGAIGGGDAKFYSGISAWFAIDDAFRLLLFVSLAGLVLALLFRRRRGPSPANGYGPADVSHHMVPFGVAIAAGAVIQKVSGLIA
jgi:prepilin peptidase CpaA